MPEKKTIQRARKDRRAGKAPSTQAGEFVREEIEHIRRGKHGAKSPEQAIAIGLSKARRAGVKLPVPTKGEASEETRRKARRDSARGRAKTGRGTRGARRRGRASLRALRRKGSSAASSAALSKHAKAAARRRGPAARREAARRAARTRARRRRTGAARRGARGGRRPR